MLVNRQLSASKPDQRVKTSRSRQANFILCMKTFGLDDPCGSIKVKNDALAVYVACIIKGENISEKNALQSVTVREYVTEINVLHELHELLPPIALDNVNDHVYRLIVNLTKKKM